VFSLPISARRRSHRLLLAAALSLLPLACAVPARAETITRALAPGITYTQEIVAGASPQVINILRVDLHAPGVRVRCGQALDAVTLNGPTKGREPVHSLAVRNGALAAVNADFFPFTGDPLGLAIRDGELLSEPLDYRACLGIFPQGVRMDVLAPVGVITASDGSALMLNGINRVPHDETVALTPSYAATPRLEKPATVVVLAGVNLPVRVSQEMRGRVETVVSVPAGTPLPPCPSESALLVAAGSAASSLAAHCRAGDTVTFHFDLAENTPTPPRGQFASRAGFLRGGRAYKPCWMDVEQAVGGGPWLVHDGQISVDYVAQNFPKDDFVERRHPRTAAGVTADGNLLLVTVDGRQSWSRGVSLFELASLMQRLGAINAINLDGGGSSTMVVGGGVVNAPSDGRERAIADALLVYGSPPEAAPMNGLRIQPNAPDGVVVRVGEPLAFRVMDDAGNPLPADTPVLWGTGDGFGFISQRGVFTASHTGTGTILARIGGQQVSVAVRVVGGSPARLKATLGSVANNPPDRNLLTVTVLDRYGNPVAGQQVAVKIVGGQALSPLVTDNNGQARAEIVWDVDTGHRFLTLWAGSAPAITLRR